jgi:phosphoglucosamine mutase
MAKLLSPAAVEAYRRDGYFAPVKVMTAEQALHYRQALEAHEGHLGGPLQGNLRHKVHLLFTWADALVHHPKVLDAIEDAIEEELLRDPVTKPSEELGRAQHIGDRRVLYQEFAKSTMPEGVDLKGLKMVVDCANGAAYKVAPTVLAELGADVIPIGCSPNGRNINDGCGSTDPSLLKLTVTGVRADLGVALDGDGDRLVMVDHLGRTVDGDQLLYLLAAHQQGAGLLKGPVVGTMMSNMGLEIALGELGIAFHRAAVGDRYVLQLLNDLGGTLGGETSGHLLCLDKTTTGDGLIAALQVLAVMKQTGRRLAELTAGLRRLPQTLVNVRVIRSFDSGSHPRVAARVAEVEQHLGGRGRVLLRNSGTEPVVRVMVEGEDADQVKRLAQAIAEAVELASREAV